MDSFHTNHVQQHIDLESNGDVTLQHLVDLESNGDVTLQHLANLESSGDVTLQHLVESSGDVTLQHLVESSGDVILQHLVESNGAVTLQHLVESISNAIVPKIEEKFQSMEKRLENMEKLMKSNNNAIVPEIKDELHLMEKRFMEVTKQEIQSMESKLHNMLKMEFDNTISLSVKLRQRQVPCNVYFTTTDSSRQRKLIVKMFPETQMVHLHLLCEHIERIHVVENQKGEEITLIDPKVRKWVPYLVIGLTIFSILLKVGAHVAVGIGDMIPNFGKGLLLALDTDALGDYLPSDGIHKMLEHDSFQGKRNLNEQGTTLNMVEEKNAAEQWLVDFLKERKKSISESFGLVRVKYHRTNNKGPLIRWVCHDCRNDGFQKKMLEDFPV